MALYFTLAALTPFANLHGFLICAVSFSV